jgi:hypothetical protein
MGLPNRSKSQPALMEFRESTAFLASLKIIPNGRIDLRILLATGVEAPLSFRPGLPRGCAPLCFIDLCGGHLPLQFGTGHRTPGVPVCSRQIERFVCLDVVPRNILVRVLPANLHGFSYILPSLYCEAAYPCSAARRSHFRAPRRF